ncbi:MAG: HPr family phosphocarrier protein [Clostridia bacterium]|nr:HPr family phosphocarrier protein [Clostridia bacterium]
MKRMVSVKNDIRGQIAISVCQLANSYTGERPTKVYLEKDGRIAIAGEHSSIMALDVKAGDVVRVVAFGPNEKKAVEELEKLLTTQYMP